MDAGNLSRVKSAVSLPLIPLLRSKEPTFEAYSPTLQFYVNSKLISLKSGFFDPNWNLLQFLRQELKLVGTRPGCGESGCGCCTVMVSRLDRTNGSIVSESVNACLQNLVNLAGAHVVTIEGLGDTHHLHPLQERMGRLHGSQCGFCTAGMVMSLYAQLKENPQASMPQLQASLNGNLCRCTGYRPILDAAKSLCKNSESSVPEHNYSTLKAMGSKSEEAEDGQIVVTSTIDKVNEYKMAPNDAEDRGKFPAALGAKADYAVGVEYEGTQYFRPLTLMGLLELLTIYPDAMVMNVNIHVGDMISIYRGMDVDLEFKKEYSQLIYADAVPEMNELKIADVGGEPHVVIGSALSMSRLLSRLEQPNCVIPNPIRDHLRRIVRGYGSKQRRANASLGGLGLQGYVDVSSGLIAAGAKVRSAALNDLNADQSWNGNLVKTEISELKEVVGQKQKSGWTVTALCLPIVSNSQLFFLRSGMRSANTRSVVSLGSNLLLDDEKRVVSLQVAFGGIKRGVAVSYSLTGRAKGKSISEIPTSAIEEDVCRQIKNDLDAWGGREEYRIVLAVSLSRKMMMKMMTNDNDGNDGNDDDIVEQEEGPISTGVQQYQIPVGHLHSSLGQPHSLLEEQQRSPVGDSLMHHRALQQCTGEAKYVDDIPDPANGLHAALVKSIHPYALVTRVDASAALALEGVEGYFDQYDLAVREKKLPEYHEKVFATGIVTAVGQCIGIVVAKSHELAMKAAKLVQVEYQPLPALLDINDAIAANSYFDFENHLSTGDVDQAFGQLSSDCVVEGSMNVGGQEHLYMEPHALLVIPGEDDEIEVYSCTQCLMKTQRAVAGSLGISCNKVTVKVKRIGGGFGGKEVLSTYTAARLAIAASKLKKPVRIRLSRSEDLRISGQRHPFMIKYRVGFSQEGKLLAMDMQLYCNAGNTTSISEQVMTRAILHAHNGYHFPNIRLKGFLCYTNVTSNTAFRGFGIPQVQVVTETIMHQVASKLKMDVNVLREMNFLKEGENVPSGQPLLHCRTGTIWQQILQSSSYKERQHQIDTYNQSSTHLKRGIAVVPTVYGISFPVSFLNQSSALVLVYADGSVLLSHGGTEMGQGLDIKMIQIAARTLGVAVNKVHISECATDKTANTPPTAASVGSDINGMAVLNACEKINERLAPLRQKMPHASFEQLADAAWKESIDLAATGFYHTEGCGTYSFKMKTDDNTRRGVMYKYFAYGAAVSEVEIDTLTGLFRCIRSDILQDVGYSLNPAIDIGQVEGAFVQGLGMYTMEQLVWGDKQHPWAQQGWLQSSSICQGVHSYLVPTVQDVPLDLRVSLLQSSPNIHAVHSSKAVGEPPLFLASSVYFAIKNAIMAARSANNIDNGGHLHLDTPLTAEVIRLACADDITAMAGVSPNFVAASSI